MTNYSTIMNDKRETKEELRARLRRKLVECGVDPDLEGQKQLQSDDALIAVCEKRVADIASHRAAIDNLKANKAQIAEEAGLSRTSISASHNPNLLKIYNFYFPKESNETVPLAEYNVLKDEKERAERKLIGHALTQAKLVVANDDNRKLMKKVELQAKSIKNLYTIIDDLKQKWLEMTGEELVIDTQEIFKKDEELEEEDLQKKLVVPRTNPDRLHC